MSGTRRIFLWLGVAAVLMAALRIPPHSAAAGPADEPKRQDDLYDGDHPRKDQVLAFSEGELRGLDLSYFKRINTETPDLPRIGQTNAYILTDRLVRLHREDLKEEILELQNVPGRTPEQEARFTELKDYLVGITNICYDLGKNAKGEPELVAEDRLGRLYLDVENEYRFRRSDLDAPLMNVVVAKAATAYQKEHGRKSPVLKRDQGDSPKGPPPTTRPHRQVP